MALPREGVDYSEGYPGATALKAVGKTFVCRYVPYNNVAKGLTNVEKLDLLEEGLSIAMVFEMFADDPRQGYDRGVLLAQMALRGMRSLGFPDSVPIYFAVDWDAIYANEFAAIDAFLRGAAGVIGAGRVGIYGGIRVIDHCASVGSARWFWQTYAWSYGQISSSAHIYQYDNYGNYIGGQPVDLDRALKPDFGQYPRPGPTGSGGLPDTAEPAPHAPTAGGLPVTFIPLPTPAGQASHATILKGKPRRNGYRLTSTNLGTTTKDEAINLFAEVVGDQTGPGSTRRWFLGAQYINGWKWVYIPLVDLKARNFK